MPDHYVSLREIKPYLEKSYSNFVRELCYISSVQDLSRARLTKLSKITQDGEEKRIKQLTVKVFFRMSFKDRRTITATNFLSCMSDRVMPQQLLAAGKGDKVQLVD